jgi:DNA-binding SARP family transcriptional activator
VDFRILGPLEAVDAGRTVALGGAKQRALLAVLLLRAGEVVSADRIVDELWGAEPPATAAHTIQVFVSRLRKALEPGGAGRLLTRPPGYTMQLEDGELDLQRFEQLVHEGRARLESGDPAAAADLLREALGLWRGPALADFAYEPFAQAAIGRLEELRLSTLEERIEADLACGRHGELVSELEALVVEHALRERLRGQLMLALYRCGRQAEALEAFQEGRRALVDELGIDPSPALQRLERAILQQDPSLEPAARQAAASPPAPPPAVVPERSILLLATGAEADGLVALAEPLARSVAPHELILAALVEPGGDLRAAALAINERRAALAERGVPARAAAFTSGDVAADLIRLAADQEVDLLLVPGEPAQLGPGLAPALGAVLADAACDVGVVVGGGRSVPADQPVLVPFGGAEHDWGALELGAWLASARRTSLRLLGTEGRDDEGRRDASRLLALAALSVQQLVGVATEPALAPGGAEGLLGAAAGAGLLVIGFSDTWRSDGLGATRAAAAHEASVPVVLVRKGLRPGGLAPGTSMTRFTWSLGGPGS